MTLLSTQINGSHDTGHIQEHIWHCNGCHNAITIKQEEQ